eukprot:6126901-Alexandrium_andersonii.AAC.1
MHTSASLRKDSSIRPEGPPPSPALDQSRARVLGPRRRHGGPSAPCASAAPGYTAGDGGADGSSKGPLRM